MDKKKEIRNLIKILKAQVSHELLTLQSDKVVQMLVQNEKVRDAKTILAYYPLPDELDIRPFLDLFYKEKRILLPVIHNNEICLKKYQGKEALREGAYRILEPVINEFSDDLDAIDVVLIPGVAFTRDGKRLGRGKGYYDRFLPKLSTAFRIGVCYDFQLSDTLPTESYDQIMDLVISP